MMTVSVKEEWMKPVALALCVLMLTLFAAADVQAAYGVGDPIADFTLNDAYGSPVTLYDFDGRVVVLNFWQDT